ncbi:hypothetical protein QX51_08785 [Terrisporobacter othiniensis]|uniref:BMC domain-containing protein n=1 Tax=Terrisporobacter othiniensis TaxID=1577792 RepID=A0A0B3W4I9_9FIRM|nr:BMC domain-containing protein [Terrisporobacter othiniensis]KHS57322.1 hypothetical protein QX51_08785 [Terrisporobacter othiniensis]
MSQLSIGIIEVIGLSSAIELADVCVKSANVNLIGYELSQGNGMVVIKIEGDVGAVTAAVQASSNVGKVYSKKIIPRPGEGIECLIKNNNTVGYDDKDKNTDDDTNVLIIDDDIKEIETINEEIEEVEDDETNKEIKEIEINENTKEEEINNIEENNPNEDNSKEKYTCNLCKDPKCPREKGDLRVNCIHHEDK